MEMIGLKAPGNYSDHLWSNKIWVLLCEVPKPNIFMISGCLRPAGTLIHGFEYTKLFQKI